MARAFEKTDAVLWSYKLKDVITLTVEAEKPEKRELKVVS